MKNTGIFQINTVSRFLSVACVLIISFTLHVSGTVRTKNISVPCEKNSKIPGIPDLLHLNAKKLWKEAVVSTGDQARLLHVFDKARRGEKIVIGAIGGSITRAGAKIAVDKRYSNLVLAWWRETFPNTEFELVNAGIGATGSDYGALRVRNDLLSKHPDFVIIEFAANDRDTPEFAESYEGLVRQVLNAPQKPAVMLLFMTRKDGSNVQEPEIKIGAHYQLPMISYRNAVWTEMKENRLLWEQISPDEVHPNENGHAIAGSLLCQTLDKALKKYKKGVLPDIARLPVPLYSDRFENTSLFDGEALIPVNNQGWVYDGSGRDNKGWKTLTPGSSIEFEISGSDLYLSFWKVQGPMGKAKVTVDGQNSGVFDGWFDQTWGGYRNMITLGRNLAKGKHLVRIELLPDKNENSTGNEFRVLCIGSTGVGPVGSTAAVKEINLSSLDWKLWGYRADSWRKNFDYSRLYGDRAEYMNIPAKVPGSVQKALKDAGIINDWNIGTNSTSSEWVENRHWLFVTRIPDQYLSAGNAFTLHCDGLDQKGLIYVNGKEAGTFNNAFVPYDFDLTPFLKGSNNTLAIIFECPPPYMGHSCWTSKIKDWKPRFYYGWDWTPRIVQIGIWDQVSLQVTQKGQVQIKNIQVSTEADKLSDLGELKIKAELSGQPSQSNIRIVLADQSGTPVLDETVPASELLHTKSWNNLKIKRWWPNGSGSQPLYQLTVDLLNETVTPVQKISKKVGFKHIEWLPCKDAPKNADPWICSVNNRPVFLQGINWTPILPNFADLTEEQYRKLLLTYKELGFNVIRIWGGGFAEKDWLYNFCDEMGIMIMQDFPISSSGLDNYPSKDPQVIAEMSCIVKQYLSRLQHHISILLWCGGNELYELTDNNVPVTDQHIMIRTMKECVNLLDPQRRFITGSPSGPNKTAGWNNFGKGINWDVHGPWNLPFASDDSTMNAVSRFWKTDDALFHSEVGVPGAMSAEMINKYRGQYNAMPANTDNPLWRTVNWWIDWNEYIKGHYGKSLNSIEEYVEWSQKRQTEGLCIALKSCKERFPGCGGFIIWMGHDSYPCPVNTSLIDFDGNLKPAAVELQKILKSN